MLLRNLTLGACLLALAASSGCVAILKRRIEKQAMAEAQRQVQNMPIFRYIELKNQQRWEEALVVLRQEAAAPTLADDTYVTQVYTLLIGALGDVVTFKGMQPGFDEEAERYYQKAKAIAGSDQELQAQLTTIYALYFSKTRRNRKALPYLRQAYEIQDRAGNEFGRIQALDGIASVYYDMGELELGDHYRQAALQRAGEYFVWPSSPEDPSQWLAYTQMLTKENDRLAGLPGSVPRIEANWAIIEPIVDTHIRPKYVSHFTVAEHLAIAGDHRAAARMYAKGVQLQAEIDPALVEAAAADRLCKKMLLDARAGRAREALADLPPCEQARTKAGFTTVDPTFERVRGEVYEANGQLREAIAAYRSSVEVWERTRASIPVEERAPFFRSLARRSSWGLIRATTRRYGATGQEVDFVDALTASDSMRARQLGELTARMGQAITLRDLAQLRRHLGSGHALVSLVVTDREVIVQAVSDSRAVATLVPHDGRLPERIAELVARIGEQGSGMPASQLDAEMKELGRALLGPISGVLAGQSRITVVPDGVLAAFPFELLVEPGGGHPLVDRFVVASVPSIALLLRSRPPSAASARLLALGDPTYEAPKGGLGYASQQDIEATSRASSYLQYFRPLPETRTELQSIAALFDGKASLLLGGEASESKLATQRTQDFSVVHFATHGVLGGEVPGLDEPALVLAAEPGQDGFLTASEAAALHLDAELTVLSACNTGNGRVAGAEGVMGMSRSFLLAGSRAVVVSLWPVDSRATEALMVRFYRHHRRGLDAGSALRQAKLDIRSTAGWEHPYFWSAFIVVGEGSSLHDRGTAGPTEPVRRDPGPGTDDDRGFELTPTQPPPAPTTAVEEGEFADDYSIRSPFDGTAG